MTVATAINAAETMLQFAKTCCLEAAAGPSLPEVRASFVARLFSDCCARQTQPLNLQCCDFWCDIGLKTLQGAQVLVAGVQLVWHSLATARELSVVYEQGT